MTDEQRELGRLSGLIEQLTKSHEDLRKDLKTTVDSLVCQRIDMESQKTHTKNIWYAIGVIIASVSSVAGWLWGHISGGK